MNIPNIRTLWQPFRVQARCDYLWRVHDLVPVFLHHHFWGHLFLWRHDEQLWYYEILEHKPSMEIKRSGSICIKMDSEAFIQVGNLMQDTLLETWVFSICQSMRILSTNDEQSLLSWRVLQVMIWISEFLVLRCRFHDDLISELSQRLRGFSRILVLAQILGTGFGEQWGVI